MVINYDLPTSAVEYIHRIGEAWLTNHLLFPISEVFNVDALVFVSIIIYLAVSDMAVLSLTRNNVWGFAAWSILST